MFRALRLVLWRPFHRSRHQQSKDIVMRIYGSVGFNPIHSIRPINPYAVDALSITWHITSLHSGTCGWVPREPGFVNQIMCWAQYSGFNTTHDIRLLWFPSAKPKAQVRLKHFSLITSYLISHLLILLLSRSIKVIMDWARDIINDKRMV